MTPEQWEKIKKTGFADSMNFTGFSFCGEKLAGFQFRNCIFDGADFRNTTFTAVSFQGENTVFSDNSLIEGTWERVVFQVDKISNCKFEQSDLKQCVFQNIKKEVLEAEHNSFAGSRCQKLAFQNVKGVGENFSHALLDQCVFQECSYENSVFFRCLASGCAWANTAMVNTTFDEADFSRMNLNGCRCSGTKSSFRKTNLSKTVWERPQAAEMNFCGADLSNALWKGGNFQKSNFTGAVFDGADFSACSNFRGATMSNVSMYRADFSGAQMGAVKESGENGADLSGAYMEEANLSGADLYNVNLAGCAWYTMKSGSARPEMARKTRLDQVNLSGAFLLGLDLGQATMTGANFDGSILCGANFGGANFGLSAEGRRVSFSGAWLSGADFLECRMNSTVFSDASVMLLDGPYFWRPAEDAAELDQGVWPKAYPEIFAKQGRIFDAGASMEVVRKGKLWKIKISDKDHGFVYTLHAENGKIAVRGGVVGVPLFAVDTKYTEALEQGRIPSELAGIFSENGYPLPGNATVKVKETGRYWKIDHLFTDTGSCYEAYNLIKSGEVIWCNGYTPVLTFPKGRNQGKRDIYICDYTRIFPEDFGAETICPDGEYFSEYPKRRTFEELMRAKYPTRY